MKLFYTEDVLFNSFEKVKKLYYRELSEYKVNKPIIGLLKRVNGEKSLTNCFIDIDEKGILVILINPFKVTEIEAYQYLKYEEIQGIKVKKGLINYIIKIQFYDGTKYVFQIPKRKLKANQNQRINTDDIISIMNMKNLNNMDNKIYKSNLIKNKILNFLYALTLTVLEIFSMLIYLNNASGFMRSEFLIIVVALVVAGIHFIIFWFIKKIINYLRDMIFVKEYTLIIDEYSETHDAYKLLQSLLDIKKSPISQDKKNEYYLSLSTAYIKTNNKGEAKKELLKIMTNDLDMIQEVKKQLILIQE